MYLETLELLKIHWLIGYYRVMGSMMTHSGARFQTGPLKCRSLALPQLRIFKEKSLGRSIGILVSGCVDIIANGRKAVGSKRISGRLVGDEVPK